MHARAKQPPQRDQRCTATTKLTKTPADMSLYSVHMSLFNALSQELLESPNDLSTSLAVSEQLAVSVVLDTQDTLCIFRHTTQNLGRIGPILR